MSKLREWLKPVAEDGAVLTREQARAALVEMLEGEASDVEAGALLTAMATRGEMATELDGFVEEMRARATEIPLFGKVSEYGTGFRGFGAVRACRDFIVSDEASAEQTRVPRGLML